jgi:alkanesulfonate monooxygenase SsuD/methylene tetrahydromethanopterin reductase-like flavin-dependent oxidoreductase (luciferase family)
MIVTLGDMEFGVLYDMRNPRRSGIPNVELYRQTLAHIERMEQLGFDTVWLTEHHFIDDDYLPSVLTMAAAVAARTSRVTIGTAVLLLPLHDPIRVAEDAAVVDVLSGGRLRLGLGLGYKVEEFDAFGIDRRARPSLLEEGIEIIRGAWADGPFSHHGRHRSFDAIDVTPKPAQRPGPQIWLAGRAPVPVARAATIGDGLIVVGGPDLYAEYHDAHRRSGRSDPARLCIFAFTYPTHDPQRDLDRLGPFAAYRMENYARWYGTAGDLASDRELLQTAGAANVAGAMSFFGTPDRVIDELKAAEAAGATAALWFATLPGTTPDATTPLFETLASDVMPAFR